jgi:RNA polymerase sigma-70 factor (ECF subfamily)
MTADERPHWLRDVIAQTGPRLVRFAARLSGRDRGQDVTQDVFERLCEADRRDVEGREAEWLFTVCRRRAVDLHRRDRVRARDLPPPHEGATPEEALLRAEHITRLRSMVGSLPDRQRDVLRMRFDEGLSYREIHERTGWSVSYVGWLLHTTLRALREQMEDDDGR